MSIISETDAKQYLLQVKMIRTRINNKKVELEQLVTMSTSITAAVGEERVQSSVNPDKMSDYAVRIALMQEEIGYEMQSLAGKKREIIKTIEQISNQEVYDIIHKHYIQGKSWSQLEKEKNVTRQWLYKLNRRGIKEVSKILSQNQK